MRTRLPAEVLKLWPPRQSRFVLNEMPVFAGCDRRQLSRVARWGDVFEVGPGEVLVREDYTDYWFFVILEGSARVTHGRREIASLQRGNHFGELAIVGFRPQPATVTAAEPSVLFVLGRQHLLSLVSLDPSIQRALFPGVPPGRFAAFRQRLQEEGRRSWDRLVPRQRRMLDEQLTGSGAARQGVGAPKLRPPGRTLTWDEAIDQLSFRDRRGPVATHTDVPESTRRSGLIAAALLTAAVTVVALLFHPPLAVVTTGRPIDVVKDISIAGTSFDRPTGRYLMTTVDVDRPNLAGVLYAWALRRTVLPARSGSRELDLEPERRHGREAFLQSQRQAIALAERELGVDATGLTIAIRDRGITGPSAGLIYALAIVDMLDSEDLADGRVIAATGELRPDASVGRVAFVGLKARTARDGGAVLFLVPASQRADAHEKVLTVVGVADLKAAVRALRAHERRPDQGRKSR